MTLYWVSPFPSIRTLRDDLVSPILIHPKTCYDWLFFQQMKTVKNPCNVCQKSAILKRPKTGDLLCKECFFVSFEKEIHQTITNNKLFKSGERIAIGVSGGKDSTVLAYVMKYLNEKYKYGLELFLLSIDEGIKGNICQVYPRLS